MKTGDAILSSDARFDHMGSDSHANGIQSDFENAEDAAVLAQLTHKSNMADDEHFIFDGNENNGLLSRPKSSGRPNAESNFSFAKVSHEQIDLTGTRKGPAMNTTVIGGTGGDDSIPDAPDKIPAKGTVADCDQE